MPTHSAVWQETKLLLEQGLNLIAVRDKQEGNFAAKTPYHGWKEYQKKQITHEELFHHLETHNTNAVAIICGAVSGNLEVIDVDVKHEPGIDALLFEAIKEIYPNLWHVLRIHKTPSGGYHILYKVLGKDVEGNKKLAERDATAAELEKSKSKKKAFIETRGEGGYVLAPPSFGYAIFKNNEIPIISWQDRCSLINICRSFSQIREEIKEKPPQHKTDDAFYDEKPWDDYDRRCDFLNLVEQNGWTYVKKKGSKIWLTKPGGKKNEVHAAIFQETKSGQQANLFYIHTTDTELTPNKIYTPSQFITQVQFAGDWKNSTRYFVQQGYGRIKPKIEQDFVSKGRELPPNASQEAQKAAQQHQKLQEEVHLYGIFWEINEKEKVVISRERLYDVANRLGFRMFRDGIVRILPPFIYEQSVRQFYDIIKEYIKEPDGDLYEDICNTYETFLQESGKFTASRLLELDMDLVLEDTRSTCNKFYLNCYLEITQNNIQQHTYADMQKLVFHNRVQQREYYNQHGGVYPEFLHYALGSITDHIKQTIGYLAHEYKDETTGYIIVLIEKVADPKMGGGSGKNLFSQLLSHTTTFISRPGSGAKFNEKFFQSWNGQKIFAINDVDETFDFIFLKDPAAGNILWKRLWKNEISIAPKDTPKLIVNTNYSYDVSDGGLARRIKPIEFTDYFTKAGGVDVVFNKHFTDDWTQEDWNGYDTFIAHAVYEWLRSNRKLLTQELSTTTWEKQFIQNHKPTIWELINEYWERWLKEQNVPNDVFRRHLELFYKDNDIHQKYQPSTKNVNKALNEFAAKKRVIFYHNITMKQDDGSVGKGRQFLSRDDPPF